MFFSKSNRFNLIYLFMITFIVISFVSRTVLLSYSYDHVSLSILDLLKVYGIGLFYDFVASTYYIIPFVVYLTLVPNKIFNTKWHKIISLSIFFGFIFSLVFNGFSEWFFWEEFGKRFNFIAVDYLIYTTEVINNILESYPIPLLVSIVLLLTAFIFFIYTKKTDALHSTFSDERGFMSRFKTAGVLLMLPVIFYFALYKQNITEASSNRYNIELSKNGFYSLFSAFRNNSLDYDEFYITQDEQQVLTRLRSAQTMKNASFTSDDLNNITRHITADGEEKKYNVMLIMIESMSAEYMGTYGSDRGLTPKLDQRINASLFFKNFYATGTRTVRGMEAVSLSIPPTPGRSIVKRPENADMASIGAIFKEKGYINKFIYGGQGYFDNMNEFFSHNGFGIVDRANMSDDEVSFENAWGVCDEDLFNKSMKEADLAYNEKKPFFNFIMTTSNHRPFTYPDGKIDVPSHEGRHGGVKYTDYAIDKFLKDAESKPWFDNTLFVIISDHNGGSAGAADLPVSRYLIPFFIYAPKIIEPKVVTKLSSQIDAIPTVMGLMNWSYDSKIYGNNILNNDFKEQAFIGNYQKLGLLRGDAITILSPNATAKRYKIAKQTLYDVTYKEVETVQKDLDDTITYYQSAAYLYKNNLYQK